MFEPQKGSAKGNPMTLGHSLQQTAQRVWSGVPHPPWIPSPMMPFSPMHSAAVQRHSATSLFTMVAASLLQPLETQTPSKLPWTLALTQGLDEAMVCPHVPLFLCNVDLAGPSAEDTDRRTCLGTGGERPPLCPKALCYLRQTSQLLLRGGEAGGGKCAPGTDPGTLCQQSKYPWAATGHQQFKHQCYHLLCAS